MKAILKLSVIGLLTLILALAGCVQVPDDTENGTQEKMSFTTVLISDAPSENSMVICTSGAALGATSATTSKSMVAPPGVGQFTTHLVLSFANPDPNVRYPPTGSRGICSGLIAQSSLSTMTYPTNGFEAAIVPTGAAVTHILVMTRALCGSVIDVKDALFATAAAVGPGPWVTAVNSATIYNLRII